MLYNSSLGCHEDALPLPVLPLLEPLTLSYCEGNKVFLRELLNLTILPALQALATTPFDAHSHRPRSWFPSEADHSAFFSQLDLPQYSQDDHKSPRFALNLPPSPLCPGVILISRPIGRMNCIRELFESVPNLQHLRVSALEYLVEPGRETEHDYERSRATTNLFRLAKTLLTLSPRLESVTLPRSFEALRRRGAGKEAGNETVQRTVDEVVRVCGR